MHWDAPTTRRDYQLPVLLEVPISSVNNMKLLKKLSMRGKKDKKEERQVTFWEYMQERRPNIGKHVLIDNEKQFSVLKLCVVAVISYRAHEAVITCQRICDVPNNRSLLKEPVRAYLRGRIYPKHNSRWSSSVWKTSLESPAPNIKLKNEKRPTKVNENYAQDKIRSLSRSTHFPATLTSFRNEQESAALLVHDWPLF